MPVTLKLTFPGGRYHATPWGRHVNEGVPEWPPSPWRILRALVAVWKRSCPDLTEDQVKRILSALTDPPEFALPAYRVAHTRHYMPLNTKSPKELKGGGTTLLFDTFVAVGRTDPLFVRWPQAKLSVEDEAALRRIASNLTSLGRAEGWVEAEVVSFPDGSEPQTWNSTPAATTDPNPVPVLCPDPGTVFGEEHYPKKLKKGERLFDCPRWHLCLDTETIHSEKWPRVPGSMWVNYNAVPPSTGISKPPPAKEPSKPQVARFLLDAPVLPLVTDTVLVAEAVRAAAMGRFKKWCTKNPESAAPYRRVDEPDKFSSPVLSGKSREGVMRTDHGHAHYLPESADRRRITHVTIWSTDGFGPGEVTALTGLRTVKLGENELRVQLVGLGRASDFNAELFRPSRTWISATPVIGPSHVGRSGRERYLLKSVRRELRRMVEDGRLPAMPTGIELEPELESPRGIDFRRARSRRRDDSGRQRPFGMFRLTFAESVCGPLCVGYGSHYGLGRFRPISPFSGVRADRC